MGKNVIIYINKELGLDQWCFEGKKRTQLDMIEKRLDKIGQDRTGSDSSILECMTFVAGIDF